MSIPFNGTTKYTRENVKLACFTLLGECGYSIQICNAMVDNGVNLAQLVKLAAENAWLHEIHEDLLDLQRSGALVRKTLKNLHTTGEFKFED